MQPACLHMLHSSYILPNKVVLNPNVPARPATAVSWASTALHRPLHIMLLCFHRCTLSLCLSPSCIPVPLLSMSLVLFRAPVAMAVHERGDDAAIDYAREGAVGSGY